MNFLKNSAMPSNTIANMIASISFSLQRKKPKISVTTSTRAKISVRKGLKIEKKIMAVVMLYNIQIRSPPDNKTAGHYGQVK